MELGESEPGRTDVHLGERTRCARGDGFPERPTCVHVPCGADTMQASLSLLSPMYSCRLHDAAPLRPWHGTRKDASANVNVIPSLGPPSSARVCSCVCAGPTCSGVTAGAEWAMATGTGTGTGPGRVGVTCSVLGDTLRVLWPTPTLCSGGSAATPSKLRFNATRTRTSICPAPRCENHART